MPDETDDAAAAQSFARNMETIYAARAYDTDIRYSEFSPAYLQRVHSMESAYVRALGDLRLRESLGSLRALDFGCGNGHWMARMASWGFRHRNLSGVDIREGAVLVARELLGGCRIDYSADGAIPHADAAFDVCFVNLVFTSILDEERRRQAAAELQRVTRAGGFIFVLDFRLDNPSNSHVRKLTVGQVRGLFDHCRLVGRRSLVLAPPLASAIAPRARWLASALEAVPLLRTHFLAILARQAPGDTA